MAPWQVSCAIALTGLSACLPDSTVSDVSEAWLAVSPDPEAIQARAAHIGVPDFVPDRARAYGEAVTASARCTAYLRANTRGGRGDPAIFTIYDRCETAARDAQWAAFRGMFNTLDTEERTRIAAWVARVDRERDDAVAVWLRQTPPP